jgi:hypothetical protein
MLLANVDETKHPDGSPSVGYTAASKYGRFECAQLSPVKRLAPKTLPPTVESTHIGVQLGVTAVETGGYAAASKIGRLITEDEAGNPFRWHPSGGTASSHQASKKVEAIVLTSIEQGEDPHLATVG